MFVNIFTERGLCRCCFILYAEKKIRVGSRTPFTSSTSISRLFLSSSVGLWFQVRTEGGQRLWLGDDLQTTQYVSICFLTRHRCLFKRLCKCRESCLQQKWGGCGSGEEDTSAGMLRKPLCGAASGGMWLLAGL